jgi:phage regulator Rha-like protein
MEIKKFFCEIFGDFDVFLNENKENFCRKKIVNEICVNCECFLNEKKFFCLKCFRNSNEKHFFHKKAPFYYQNRNNFLSYYILA